MIISTINTKGGVGKTIMTVHLGAALAQSGHRTLLIDADAQHSLTSYFAIDARNIPTTIDVLLANTPLNDAAISVRERLDVIPSKNEMERAEVELATAAGGEVRMRRAVKSLTGYDFVLIDCASGWTTVTRNALLASNAFIVPINSEPGALAPARLTVAGARELSEFYDHEVALLGVLLSRHRATNVARAVETSVVKTWGEAVFKTRIRQVEKVNELSALGSTIGDVSRTAGGAVTEDFQALLKEVLKRAKKLQTTKAK